jgi:autotransporter translocation and assembly factor TamB
VDINTLEFHSSARSISPEKPPFGIDSLRGNYSYKGNFRGKIDCLSGNLIVQIIDGGYADYSIDTAYIESQLIDGQRLLSSLKLRKDLYKIESSGDFGLNDRQGTLSAQLYQMVSDPDRQQVEGPTREILFSTIQSSFDFKNPEDLIISLQAIVDSLNILNEILPDSVIHGGTLVLSLDFRGSPDLPELDLSARLSDMLYDQIPIDLMTLDASFNRDRFSIQSLSIKYLENNLTADADFFLKKGPEGNYIIDYSIPTSGSISVRDFNLTAIQPFLSQERELDGLISLDIAWDGTVRYPRPAGFIEIDKGRIRLNPESVPVEQITLSAVLQDSILNIENAGAYALDYPLNLTGSAMLNKDGRLRSDLVLKVADIGELHGSGEIYNDSIDYNLMMENIDLRLLKPFLEPEDKIGGILDCQLSAAGLVNSPTLDGSMEAREIMFSKEKLPLNLSEGRIKIKFDQQKVIIDTLSTKFNEGIFNLGGRLAYDTSGINNIDLHAHMSGIKLNQPRIYTINLESGQLNYSRRNGYYLLDGDLKLGESRLLADFSMKSLLPWAQSVERMQPELPMIIQKTRLDIRIRESDKLWVDNNLAKIRLHSELGIIGSPAQPNFSGMMSIDEGYLIYLDRRFKVTRGTFYFVDPNKFNPEINFKAEASVTSYQGIKSTPYLITLSAEGTLEELITGVYSEPSLDKANIVSLLTLGATRSQLLGKDEGTGEASTRDILLERAAMYTSQKASSYFSRKVGNLFGLDEVSVEGNLFRFNESWGPTLLASKRFSERVSMTYTTNVGHLNDQSIRLDYLLTKYISLQGQTDQRGRSALDIKYRLRFK